MKFYFKLESNWWVSLLSFLHGRRTPSAGAARQVKNWLGWIHTIITYRN